MTNKQASEPALKQPSVVEKIAGSPVTGIGAGLVSVLAGDFAGLLPSLFDTLARGRQIDRIEQALRILDTQMQRLGATVHTMSDDQYKVATDAVAAMFATIEEDKLRLLRAAALGAVKSPHAVAGYATPLGRLLRDLSVEEVGFLVQHAAARGFMLLKEAPAAPDAFAQADGRVFIMLDSPEESVMAGLISLGLLYTRQATWDASLYEWSPVAARLVELLTTQAE